MEESILEAQTNMEKYDNYRYLKADLKKAMNAGFYYQAIFIEYAIAEDRCCSALIYAGVKHLNKRGFELKLSEKIRKLREHSAFTAKYPRKRLPPAFLDELIEWKRERDALVHDLVNRPYNDDALREIAERGKTLTDQLSNRVRSVNEYHKKQNLQREIITDEQGENI